VPKSVTQTCNTAILSKPLHRDLTVYALAAGAAGVSLLALASPANAQIVYTPLHKVFVPGTSVRLDFNGDGIVDVTIQDRFFFHTSFNRRVKGAMLSALPAAPPYGGIAKRYYNAAGAFAPGRKIGSSRSFNPTSGLMGSASSLHLDYYFGSWMSEATNKYLGVRFSIAGKPHFAWVRMNVQWQPGPDGIRALLTGYAYETEPSKAIIAGDTGSGNADGADAAPTSEMFSEPEPEATLGALALGASGLTLWRRGGSLHSTNLN
jgi:hypothetical protein